MLHRSYGELVSRVILEAIMFTDHGRNSRVYTGQCKSIGKLVVREILDAKTQANRKKALESSFGLMYRSYGELVGRVILEAII